MALGLIFNYFYQRRLWKAAILIIAVIPAAIMANAIRVAAMGLFPALVEGFLHDFSGWLIFIFCFGFISLLNKVLNYIQPTEVAPKDSCPSETLSQGAVVNYNPYLIIALAILLIITPLTLRVAEVPPLPLLQSFDHFPHQLGDWQQVRRNYIDPEIFKKTGAHDYYEADFKNHDNAPASLYIAYAEKMEGGLAHNPKYCMVGGGWETIGTGTEDIFPGFPVHYLILKMGDNRILVYYWNLQQGKWMAKERLYYKAQIIFNSILTRRSDWALIRLITPVNPDLKEAQARLIDFARSITPSLPQFIQK
jgi:EpsI family protein